MRGMRRNIEIKRRCPDLAGPRGWCRNQATSGGVLQQVDTYFHVPHGRLKLREINDSQFELIWYDRVDTSQPRPSNYLLLPVPNRERMKRWLVPLGQVAQVVKRRELYHWHNVRIHLDEVLSLGCFVELEAVVGEDFDHSTSERNLQTVRAALRLDECDAIEQSYADLILKR